ncbi:MAG: GHKL domain-containing protein [Solobacterium sp.]|nr:GHKL domain-containing protein [Solobacterium sp.]
MDIVNTTIRTYAIQLSLTRTIKDALCTDTLSTDLMEHLDQVVDSEEYIDYIVLVKPDDTRLYHPDHSLISLHFQGGDEGPALKGAIPYITDGKGTSEYQRRCFATVYDDDGMVIGFVMVSCHTRSLRLLAQTELLRVLFLYLVSLAFGAIIAVMTARGLRRRLLGYEPAHIAELFLQREDVLNSLNEGLILVNQDWQCEYMNRPAVELLSAGDLLTPAQLQTLIKDEIQKLAVQEDLLQVRIKRGDSTLLVDTGPIMHNEKRMGTLILLNDMTRSQRLAEELTGVRHIIDALRSFTHEQKNRLHVILGLLQLSEVREAMTYISDTITYEENNSQILNTIQNKTIAALILGKMNKARELGIDLQLVKGSFLEAHNDYLSAEDLVTIIGNLIENAFEAMTDDSREKKIDLFIQCSGEGLVIIVDDNGEGMDEETKQKLCKGGFTTKGEGHGTGLRLIRNIVNRCHGIFDIESEPGEGSSFTIAIREKRKRMQGGKNG